jgi:integrase
MATIQLDPRIKCVGTRGAKKLWTARVSRGFAANGRRRQWRFTFAGNRKEDVRDAFQGWLTHKEQEANTGVERTRTTVANYFEHWIVAKRSDLAPSTWARYHGLVHKHVIPHLGGLALQKVTGVHLRGFYGKLREGGLSPMSVHHAHAIVHRILADAVEDKLITFNPADFKRGKPRARHCEMRVLTEEEAAQLLDAVYGTRWFWIVAMGLWTGERRGELCANRWEDVDLERGTIAVRRSLSQVRLPKRDANGKLTYDSSIIIKPTKTGRERVVALSPQAVEMLRQHRLELARTRVPSASDPLFPNLDEQGRWLPEPTHPDTLTAQFAKTCRDAKLAGVHFHTLRHTCASFLLAQGVHPKVVQEMLGHASVRTTLDLYSHTTPSLQAEAARRLDSVIRLPMRSA